MKKLMLILFALAITAGAFAQHVSPAVELGADQWYYKFTGAVTDTASTGGAWSKIIMPNKPERLFYDFRVKITEVSATTSTAVAFKAKKMAGDAWTTVTTTTYKGTGTDTTITFAETSTASFYRFYQIVCTPANGKVKAETVEMALKK